jgi:hypothetical protein
MEKISAGIPSDIDLTDRRVFQDGARDVFGYIPHHPGELPWDSDGKITISPEKRRAIAERPYTQEEFDFFMNMEIDLIDDDRDLLSQYQEMEILYQYQRSSGTNKDVMTFKVQIDNTISDLMEKMKDALTEDDFMEFLEQVTNLGMSAEVKGGNIITSYPKSVEYKVRSMYKYYMTQSLGWESRDNNSWQLYDSSTGLDIQYNVSETDEKSKLTPRFLRDVKLTKKELNGFLPTGTGEEVYLKTLKLHLLKRVKEFLGTEQISRYIYDVRTCSESKRTWIPLIESERYNLLCPEKKLEEYFSLSLPEYNRASAIRGNFRSFTEPQFKDCAGRNQIELNYPQSDWYYARDDKAIDYFFQPVPQDRGVNLMRIPRGSHELRVAIGSQVLDDDDSDERRQNLYDSRLTYEKYGITVGVSMLGVRSELYRLSSRDRRSRRA